MTKRKTKPSADELKQAKEALEDSLGQRYGEDAGSIILSGGLDPTPIKCQTNTTVFTRAAVGDHLKYNAFNHSVYFGEKEVDDNDCVIIQETVELDTQSSMALAQIQNAVELIARENQYHPVRDYLNGLPAWDGVDRVGLLFISGFGCEDNVYHREVGRMFLVSAIARIIKPGCKADSGPLLTGPTGIGKSMSMRLLFGEEWVDDLDFGANVKDMAMKLRGVWVLEFAELAGMYKSDVEKIKSFISRTDDRQRDQWARKVKSNPRQCVFYSTSNEDAPLRDNTGNRRFWPIKVEKVDWEWLAANRDQLWAEALMRFNRGEKWWDDGSVEGLNSITVTQQLEATESDVWESRVLKYCEKKPTATLDDILFYLGFDVKDFDQLKKNRLSGILKKHGWTRRRRGYPVQQWVYVNPQESQLPAADVLRAKANATKRKSIKSDDGMWELEEPI